MFFSLVTLFNLNLRKYPPDVMLDSRENYQIMRFLGLRREILFHVYLLKIEWYSMEMTDFSLGYLASSICRNHRRFNIFKKSFNGGGTSRVLNYRYLPIYNYESNDWHWILALGFKRVGTIQPINQHKF